jgi:hypothetical protein
MTPMGAHNGLTLIPLQSPTLDDGEDGDKRYAWERLPGESAKAYEAFQLYLDLGSERTYAQVARELGQNVKNFRERWPKKHQWNHRAIAYDEHLSRLALAAAEEERKEMARRQVRLGTKLQAAAERGLDVLVEMENVAIAPNEIVGLAKAGVTIERLARGESTENKAQHQALTINFEGGKPQWWPKEQAPAPASK